MQINQGVEKSKQKILRFCNHKIWPRFLSPYRWLINKYVHFEPEIKEFETEHKIVLSRLFTVIRWNVNHAHKVTISGFGRVNNKGELFIPGNQVPEQLEIIVYGNRKKIKQTIRLKTIPFKNVELPNATLQQKEKKVKQVEVFLKERKVYSEEKPVVLQLNKASVFIDLTEIKNTLTQINS